MALYLYIFREVALCALLSVALMGFIGGGVLAWKAAEKLVGGVRQARARLTSGRLSGVFALAEQRFQSARRRKRYAMLAFPPALKSAPAVLEPELASKTA